MQVFVELSKMEGDAIFQRDAEDGEKLAKGIEISIEKGVLEKIEPPKYTQIQVLGKTADEVADEIIASLGPDFKGG
jgi:hypothetical protein